MCLPANSNVDMRGDKSFVYDLDVQRSIVSSRVALLLRSAEAKLLFNRFVQLRLDVFSFFCNAFTSGEVPHWLQAPPDLCFFVFRPGKR